MQNQGFIIAKEGFPWITAALLSTLIFILVGWSILAYLMGSLTLFVISFFRNPPRKTPKEKGAIISPADGKICMIENVFEKRFLKQELRRVSIFMSPLNCHINRSPIHGTVKETHYNPGKFHFANVDKASDLNEQNSILLEDESQNRFVVVQIAGFIARRIISYAKKGDHFSSGERFGLIQFGSRVDLYLPPRTHLAVEVGQKVYGGETILGSIA